MSIVPPDFPAGSVWLVGAGPGDPGLLTLHALNALGAADVVLHDALVAPEILALAGKARLKQVGKRAGRSNEGQLRINEHLIHLARQGLRVVRLKGGDPFVFGRGGEEALALAAAGIAFRIVPGISAGPGGTAAVGIPLTHRTLAHTVAFATGRDATGGLPAATDWAALARGADVLALYMAVGTISRIADALIAAGRRADEPVAFISDATTPRQQLWLTTLARAATVATEIPRNAATLIVIGPVVALAGVLSACRQAAPIYPHPFSASASPAHAAATWCPAPTLAALGSTRKGTKRPPNIKSSCADGYGA